MSQESPNMQPGDENVNYRGNPESNLAYKQERNSEFNALVESGHIQGLAGEASDATMTMFIGSGCRENILSVSHPEDQRNIALEEMRKTPNLVPSELRDDEDQSAAFMIALAHRANRSPYKN